MLFSINTWIKYVINNPAKAYLFSALFFGFLFVVIVPPFFNADEPNHFFRAYQISEGGISAENTNLNLYSGMIAGGDVPLSLITIIRQANVNNLATGVKSPKFNSALWKVSLKKNVHVVTIFPNTALYSPIVYIPQVVAIEILKIFDSPPILMLYAGRLAGLLVSTLIIFYAIKIIPFGKWAIVAIGLLPMTVACFASFSADGMTIALCTLLIAYTLYLACQKHVFTRKQLTALTLLVVGVALAKLTYFLLIPIIFVIPIMNEKLRNRRSYMKLIAITLLGIIFALAWQHKTSFIKDIYPSQPAINTTAQTKYVMHNLIKYTFRIFPNSLVTNNGDGVFESMFGDFLSLTTVLPYLFMFFSAFVLCFSFIAYSPREIKTMQSVMPNRWSRYFATLIGLGLVFLLVLALYIYWTPVGANFAFGMQGRYFTPILGLGVIIFATRKVVVEDKFRSLLIWGSSFAILTVSILVCLAKLYSFYALRKIL